MADLSYPLGHKIKSALESTLQKALELDVVLSAVGGKLRATGDRASVAELAPLLRQHRDELVRLLTMPAPAVGQPLHASEAVDQVQNPAPAAASTRPPAPAKPMGWLHLDQPWRAAGRLYQNHHWQCGTCMAAARAAPGVMERCAEGQRLHDAYCALAAEARKRG